MVRYPEDTDTLDVNAWKCCYGHFYMIPHTLEKVVTSYNHLRSKIRIRINYYGSGSDFWQVTVPASYLDHKKQSLKKLKKNLPYLIVIFLQGKNWYFTLWLWELLRFNFIPVPGSAKVRN
jgi:hypothetical protein